MDQERMDLNKIKEQVDLMQKKELMDKKSISDDQTRLLSGWFDFSNTSYIKGFLIAAGVTLIATNPKVRGAITHGAIKTWAALQGGVEEFKEKIHDVRAEMSQESTE